MMRNALPYWIGAVAVLAWGAWLVGPGSSGGLALDPLLLGWARDCQGPRLDPVMGAVTWLGSLWLLLPLALGVALYLRRRGESRRALFLTGALLGAALLAQLFKHGIDRPRPDLFPPLTSLPLDPAYPSAHTMQGVAAALALALLAGRRHAWVWLPLGGAALMVAWSRIHLQVHFPSDVVAGALAAALWVLGLKRLLLTGPVAGRTDRG